MRIVTTSEIEPAPLRLECSRNAGVSQHVADSIDSMPVLHNPFRTPEILQKHRAVRVGAILRAARGLVVLGVDVKVLIWAGTHITTLLLLYACDTDMTHFLHAALDRGRPWAFWVDLKAAALIGALAILLLLYSGLYASDPGWMNDKLGVALRGAVPCSLCGSLPSVRCKHSKNTGQCVHKFDHFCWLLSTDIGDRNHRRFWTYLAVQVGLLLWGLQVSVRGALRCVGASSSMTLWCASNPGSLKPLVSGLVALFITASLLFFGYLLLLHTYLAATNQTTYEVCRGAKYAPLAPYYQGHSGKRMYVLPQQLPRLFLDDLLGRGPPKPFSLALWGNLRQFFFEPWPRQYSPPPVQRFAMDSDAEARLLACDSCERV